GEFYITSTEHVDSDKFGIYKYTVTPKSWFGDNGFIVEHSGYLKVTATGLDTVDVTEDNGLIVFSGNGSSYKLLAPLQDNPANVTSGCVVLKHQVLEAIPGHPTGPGHHHTSPPASTTTKPVVSLEIDQGDQDDGVFVPLAGNSASSTAKLEETLRLAGIKYDRASDDSGKGFFIPFDDNGVCHKTKVIAALNLHDIKYTKATGSKALAVPWSTNIPGKGYFIEFVENDAPRMTVIDAVFKLHNIKYKNCSLK
ncbi:hypothetical protein BGZ97_006333, partial [Linnemannia gamsii]